MRTICSCYWKPSANLTGVRLRNGFCDKICITGIGTWLTCTTRYFTILAHDTLVRGSHSKQLTEQPQNSPKQPQNSLQKVRAWLFNFDQIEDYYEFRPALTFDQDIYTLSRLKYLHTTKLTCTNYVIYWLSAKLGYKKEIEICKYIKYDVSALTWVKISNFSVFRGVILLL